MPIVGFTQDPESPPGTGEFHLDTGGSVYGYHPDLAQQFGPAPQLDAGIVAAATGPQPDMRVAGSGGGADLGDVDNPGFVPPRVGQTDVEHVAPGGTIPASATVEQPRGAGAAPAPVDPHVAEQQAAAAYIARPVVGQAHKAGFIPKTASEGVETEHAPFTEEDAAARRAQGDEVKFAQASAYGNQIAQAQLEQQRAEAAMPVVAAQKQKAQAAYDQIDAGYKQERAHLQKMQDEFDPNHWYKERGTLGTVGAAIGQALGAFAATRTGGQNWAQKIIDDSINRDIAAQRDKQAAAYKNLELRLGDKQQAEAALRLAMDRHTQTQISQYAASAKVPQIQADAQKWIAEYDMKIFDDERAFRDAAFGKHARKVEQAYQAASSGNRAPTEAEKQSRAETLMKLGGIAKQTAETEKLETESTGGGKEVREQAKDLAKDMESRGIAAAATGSQPLRELLQRYAGKDSIPGIGIGGDMADKAGPYGRRMLSEEGALNRGIKDRALAANMHALSGAAVAEPEVNRLKAAFEGASTVAEMRAAQEEIDAEVNGRISSLTAGYDPRAVQMWMGRGGDAIVPKPLPSTAKRIGQ